MEQLLPHVAPCCRLYEVVGKGEPPKSLADWKGMRIRALGQQGKAMQKLGAVPTSVPAPDVYTSMDRGLIDAAGFAYYAHESYRTYELGDLVHKRSGRRLDRLRPAVSTLDGLQ